MKKGNNKKIKIVLLILVLCITIGYAVLRTTLNINGIATIPRVAWDIYFANYQNSASTNVTPTTEPSTPTGTKPTTVSYAVTLSQPGDLYEFTIDVVNDGTIDANINLVSKLDDVEIDSEHPIPDYLTYKITDTSDVDIPDDHRLNKNTTETIKVKLLFREDVDPSDLPEDGATLQLDIELTATQAEKESHAERIVYTINEYDRTKPNDNRVRIDDPFPTGMEYFNNGSETGKSVYLKHKIGSDDIVKESAVEFAINDSLKAMWKETYCSTLEDEDERDYCIEDVDSLENGTYSLHGTLRQDMYDPNTQECKSEYYDADHDMCNSPYYETNKSILLQAFGEYANNYFCRDYTLYFECRSPAVSAVLYQDGLVMVCNDNKCDIDYDPSWECTSEIDGTSDCTSN